MDQLEILGYQNNKSFQQLPEGFQELWPHSNANKHLLFGLCPQIFNT